MNPNIQIIEAVTEQLGDLVHELVLVGGCACSLLLDIPAISDIRTTEDVDMICQVSSRQDYYEFARLLNGKGFHEDSREGAPQCRFVSGALVLDIMPVDESVLGFNNRWYNEALTHAMDCVLPSVTGNAASRYSIFVISISGSTAAMAMQPIKTARLKTATGSRSADSVLVLRSAARL